MENKLKPMNKLESTYKMGVILIYVAASLGLFIIFLLFCFLFIPLLAFSATPPAYLASSGLSFTTIILMIISSIFVIPSIINLVLSIKTLKEKTYKYKIALATLGIIFGGLLGIIGGILMLASNSQDNISNNQ